MMSIRKSLFLRKENGWMEQEVVALWRVNELKHKLESAHHESQYWAAKAMGAQAVELHAVKQATTTE